MSVSKKCVSFVLAVLFVLTLMTVGVVPDTRVKTQAASWNGYKYSTGKLYGSQSFLDAFGIDYDVYMKWMDDHDKDSPNPNYYLGTPYAHNDHRNPRGDCNGAYGAYDSPGVAAMNCTGFVWHVLYKSAVNSGATREQISRLKVMGGVPAAWNYYDVYRVWFDSVEDAYNSGILEKGDLMWLYGTSDNHNAIFYGDSPTDFIYWDSAGERNRYCEVHAIGQSRGLWVAKVTQPNKIELHIDTAPGGSGTKFSSKYMIFDSKDKAQACLDNPDNDSLWEKRIGTIVLDSSGHGVFRQQSAPTIKEMWSGDTPLTNHSYFKSAARRVDCSKTYYAVQWSHTDGISEDNIIHEFKDSGKRTPSGFRIYRFMAPIKVDEPAITSLKTTSDGISIKWDAVNGAQKYRIYYKNKNGSWVRMKETSSTSYLDKDVKPDTSYTYTIRCVDNYGNFISSYNDAGWKVKYQVLDTPEITDLQSTPEGVQITWNAVENTIDDREVQYRVYYKNAKGGWTKMEQTSETSYVDDAVGTGKTYTYTVRCVDAAGDFTSKFNTTGWTYTYEGVDTPQITEAAVEPNGVRLSWDAVEGVAKYRVYTKNSKGEWQKAGETAETEYFDEAVSPGTEYTYSLRCINSKGYSVSGMDTTGVKATFVGLDTPQITAFESEADGIRFSWDPVEGAVKYRVYCKSAGGSWIRLSEQAETEYFDQDVTEGNSYIYTVRCVNNKGGFTSDFEKAGWEIDYNGIDTPAITQIKSEADGVHISWSAVDGAVKYRVYYKNSKGSWVRLTETAGTSFIDDDVALGETYVYTVRCVNSKGKFASDYNKTGWKHTFGLDTPQITSVTQSAGGIKVSWNAVDGANQYRVFLKSGSSWQRLGTATATEWTFADATPGSRYTFTVRCVGLGDKYVSDFDRSGGSVTYTDEPEDVILIG